ncbi:hypothetical protein JCM8547_007374 [Rhodosporidiobolus lusitaniae]
MSSRSPSTPVDPSSSHPAAKDQGDTLMSEPTSDKDPSASRGRALRDSTKARRNMRIRDGSSSGSSSGGFEEDEEDGEAYSPSERGREDGEDEDEEDEDDEDEDEDEEGGRTSKAKGKMTVKEDKGSRGGKGEGKEREEEPNTQRKSSGAGSSKRGSVVGQSWNGRNATMNCEACRARKLKCSRGNPCTGCSLRGDLCVYPDTSSAHATKFAAQQNNLSHNRSEALRLQKLVRFLSTRYAKRENVVARQEGRSPRPPPSLADVLAMEKREEREREEREREEREREEREKAEEKEGEKVKGKGKEGEGEGCKEKRQKSSPLEDAEALLALATPAVGVPPRNLPVSNGATEPDLVVDPQASPPHPQPDKAASPPQANGDSIPVSSTSAASAPSLDKHTSLNQAKPTFPSPDVIRPFGRPGLPRSATTSEAVPSLRVSISRANGYAPSSGSSARFSARPFGFSPQHSNPRSATHSNGGFYGPPPGDPAFFPTAEQAYPHLPPFEPPIHRQSPSFHPQYGPPRPSPHSSPFLHHSSPRPAPPRRDEPPRPRNYAYPTPSFPSSSSLPQPPAHAAPSRPSTQARPAPPPRPRSIAEPTWFFPFLPSPLLSPRSVAHLAEARLLVRQRQSQPQVLNLKRQEHERRFDHELEVVQGKEGAKEAAKKARKGKRKAEAMSSGSVAIGSAGAGGGQKAVQVEEDEKTAQERKREHARRAAETWALFASSSSTTNGDGNANGAASTSSPAAAPPAAPTPPIASSSTADPSTSQAEASTSTFNAFAAVEPYVPMSRDADPLFGVSLTLGPLSAGLTSSFTRRASSSWFVLSPSGSIAGSPKLSRAGGRPLLTLDPTSPALSALRTPSAGPLSAFPGRHHISLSPMRSATTQHSAVEEGLRPFNSLRGDPLGGGGGGALFGDDRFEPMLEREDDGVDWARFEPMLEEKKRGAEGARVLEAVGEEEGEGKKEEKKEEGEAEGRMEVEGEEETGWETDGKSSVGRRSTRSVSMRSVGGGTQGGEDTEEESDEGSGEE